MIFYQSKTQIWRTRSAPLNIRCRKSEVCQLWYSS